MMGSLAIGAAALLLAATVPQGRQRGFVVALDPHYSVEVLASEDSGLGAPDGLTWHDGVLHLAVEGGRSVFRWDGRRYRLLSESPTLQSPEDLVIADDRTVYFTDDLAGGLWRIGVDARPVPVASPAVLRSTEGLTIGPQGELLVGDDVRHAVFAVSPSGAVRALVEGIEKPESLAQAPDGRLFIADDVRNRIDVRLPSGEIAPLLDATDGLGSPETIAWSAGRLYVLDNGGESGRLLCYEDGVGICVIAAFCGRLRNVQGLAVTPDGAIYVSVQSDLRRNRGYVLRLAPESAVEQSAAR